VGAKDGRYSSTLHPHAPSWAAFVQQVRKDASPPSMILAAHEDIFRSRIWLIVLAFYDNEESAWCYTNDNL
jgi:hypothetical protein